MKKIAYGLAALLTLILLLAVQPGPADGQGQANTYAGTDACKACHADQYASYSKAMHAKKDVKGSPANQFGCESCHGQGSAHVSQGGGKGSILGFGKKSAAKDKEAKCLSCHEQSRHLAFWDNGKHKIMGVTCVDCHSMHGNNEKGLKTGQPDLCFDCHKDIRMMLTRQSHHPIREGKVKCTDCHNPHGGFGPKMIKADSINELCFKCHAEKRGPFRIEHPPVAENCAVCHEVHGSNHRGMLVRKTPQLCQSCHANEASHKGRPYTSFETFKGADPSSRMFGRACLNCHTNIHGSNGEAFIK